MPPKPWPDLPPDYERFERPPREYGILPFWFLNGELDPDEMRFQLRELRDKGMPGIILHGRFGLELPYLGADYLDRIKLAVEEAQKLGLKTWIYDEMNWPSGTADGRVPREHPDLAQRYIECISFSVRGPYFTCLTGQDSRYMDFERSTPVAAFAIGGDGQVIDLTPNLSFEKVIPWQVPPGHWRIMYIVEKLADYYIDAINPEATAEFLRVGYEPYLAAIDKEPTQDQEPRTKNREPAHVGSNQNQASTVHGEPGEQTEGLHPSSFILHPSVVGFYTDEPAMHYYVTGGDNPIVPWTKDMFRRFQERNGYNLRPRLADLFFDLGPDSARVRYDFHTTLTEFYSEAYYRQIHEWCQQRDVLFTGHLLYEEWLRRMIRVEGNPFKHYRHMDVIGVDHLYPFIGTRDRPDEHVAMKLASSAAHQFGSQRLLCESFGGLFMDATMQRMKWVTDWEYVLGVTLLNPHGFHYTLEGPRKRDWPPSMFYQYPWWHYYGAFSDYVSRLSHMLTGGTHVAKVAVLWPINAMFATYTPQSHNVLGDRTESDFNTLTDMLLRLHYDFDYLDEDVLAEAEIGNGAIRLGNEAYELLILPSMAHLKLSTVERLEQFVGAGGRVLSMIFLPDKAFAPHPPAPSPTREEGEQASFNNTTLPLSPSGKVEQVKINDESLPLSPSGKVEQVKINDESLPLSPGGRGGQGVRELVDISDRIGTLFGVDPAESQRSFRDCHEIDVIEREHAGGGKTSFLRSYALARQVPLRLQRKLGTLGRAESPHFVIETEGDASRYYYAPPEGEREEITAEVVAERQAIAQTLRRAIGALIAPDVVIDNPEVFYLHRVKESQDLYFLVNPTFSVQKARVTLSGNVRPVLWDPSTGDERPIAPWRFVDNGTQFELELAPAGSAFVLAMPAPEAQIVDTNVVVEVIEDDHAEGYTQAREPYVVFDRGGRQRRLVAPAADVARPLMLDGAWEFEPEDPNALVIGKWLARAAAPGEPESIYTDSAADTNGWLPMVPGAWSYQLPAEPDAPYPIDVWYRIGFQAEYLPPKLDLIVDGFSGSGWKLFVNGEPMSTAPVRSAFDSQMKAVDITQHARAGENVIALRLTVTSPTDGLLDLLKITGDFSVQGPHPPAPSPAAAGEGGQMQAAAGEGEQVRGGRTYRIVAPRREIAPEAWTTQGYPFFSGRATYRRRFQLPREFEGQRIIVEPAMADDALELLVNGQSAGVRLWAPYAIEITDLLRPGENMLELRVANTLVNLLEATERPSGLSGAPWLVAYRPVAFRLEE